MNTMSVLAPLGAGVLAWAIAGCTISGSMQDKKHSKLVSRVSGILGGAFIGFVCLVATIIFVHDSESPKPEEETTKTVPAAKDYDESHIVTFNVSFETYVSRLNSLLERLQTGYKADFQTTETDISFDGFYKFDECNRIGIAANKFNHNVRSIVVTVCSGKDVDAATRSVSLASAAFDATQKSPGNFKVSMDIITKLMSGKYKNDEVKVGDAVLSVVHQNGGSVIFIESK